LPAFVARSPAVGSALARESAAWCNHVRSVSVERLVRLVGDLPEAELRAIDLALLDALGLEDAA
jgi:mRNA-degrading endonuclease toxin of MazEF toxin-antitoxin module